MRYLLICLGLLVPLWAIAADLPFCGTGQRGPYAGRDNGWTAQDRTPRDCETPKVRSYTPHNTGIGFDILRFESEACFVPDESFQLLDAIVDAVVARVKAETRDMDGFEKAVFVSSTTSQALMDMGFALWIPTQSLGDALRQRRPHDSEYRYMFDCDTGSMILLTVADALGMEAKLVEMVIKSGEGHNYVQWPLAGRATVNWDMNARAVCATPTEGQLPHMGRALSESEFWAYLRLVRVGLWERAKHYTEAVQDGLAAINGWPENPMAYNAVAWSVASKEFPERHALADKAMKAATKAVEMQPVFSFMDTLACMHAFKGDFATAIPIQEKAVAATPKNLVGEFRARLEKLKAGQDCTGEI